MRYVGRIAEFSTILMLSFSVASAQGSNSLQGRVIAPDGNQPLAPVRVRLTYNGRRIYETFTDLSGRFSFSGLSKGTYQLTAEGDGQSFVTTTVYAELSTFGNAPQLFTQEIQLRPLPGNHTQPKAVVNAFSQNVPDPQVKFLGAPKSWRRRASGISLWCSCRKQSGPFHSILKPIS